MSDPNFVDETGGIEHGPKRLPIEGGQGTAPNPDSTSPIIPEQPRRLKRWHYVALCGAGALAIAYGVHSGSDFQMINGNGAQPAVKEAYDCSDSPKPPIENTRTFCGWLNFIVAKDGLVLSNLTGPEREQITDPDSDDTPPAVASVRFFKAEACVGTDNSVQPSKDIPVMTITQKWPNAQTSPTQYSPLVIFHDQVQTYEEKLRSPFLKSMHASGLSPDTQSAEKFGRDDLANLPQILGEEFCDEGYQPAGKLEERNPVTIADTRIYENNQTVDNGAHGSPISGKVILGILIASVLVVVARSKGGRNLLGDLTGRKRPDNSSH